MFNNLIYEKKEKIAIITINREKYLNSLNEETLKELDNALDIVIKDKDVYVCIITGQGKAFVAGADISNMKDMDFKESSDFSKMGNEVFRKIESMEKPTIAAVNGFALGGGCELASSCDIRIASTKAKFGQPEVNLGIIPGFGGTQRLTNLVGISKAKELIYTGDIIDANEALNIKLVNKVVEVDDLMNESIKMANKICEKAQLAIRYSKKAINKKYDINADLRYPYESFLFGLCFTTNDQIEGMEAFLEKRKADFKCE